MAKMARNPPSHEAEQGYRFITNENRPDKAFTTDRAKRAGKANACSGQIFVTIPSDFFGPITSKYDPKRNIGVRVGESYEDRMECRQWGVHFPHVAGIAGQSNYGAQSVALSGGYQDDEDHGEWFLYTGSGGRDLTGNKRTNKDQAFDQVFEKLNSALKVSCLNGYPVRVVRSHKEKRSSYAPESGVRYDGVYRIEKCWRKVGVQGFKVCRYLFIRCDNEPAPWTSDDFGDRPRPLPIINELDDAIDVIERKEPPFWDHDETTGWKWMKPPPASKKTPPASKRLPPVRNTFKETKVIKCSQNISLTKKLLNELCCEICNEVMQSPVTTPCAHNFCKACLLNSYTDLSFSMDRSCGGRTLRSKKPVNNCPICPTNITDFLENPQVNREMMVMIESLQKKSQEIDSTSSDVETVSPADVETVSASDVETISMAIKKQKINEVGDGADDVVIVGADDVAIVEADDVAIVEADDVAIVEADDAETVEDRK
ncbi:E3 ubiquitin-protein ligase ORTHRUS 1 [Zostera marina]|uniref:RING-type E3 ubiquitin transferase n=1 Tax=Zostera marina TaxID=29655 RepID=A0A0K9PAE2_ZOSMR|nr:E3 ubiquitin-protein ligase ORTHRUS 1 [Zostera marina]